MTERFLGIGIEFVSMADTVDVWQIIKTNKDEPRPYLRSSLRCSQLTCACTATTNFDFQRKDVLLLPRLFTYPCPTRSESWGMTQTSSGLVEIYKGKDCNLRCIHFRDSSGLVVSGGGKQEE
jgi:hypothetical protein